MSSLQAERLNVVVVDDTPHKLRNWQQTVLKAAGDEPIQATSAEETEKVLRSTRVDLLVIDLFLSERSSATEDPEDSEGLRLIAECRKRYPHSRIIAITSRMGGSAEIGALALKAGADDFMSSEWHGVFVDALLLHKLEIYLRLLRNGR